MAFRNGAPRCTQVGTELGLPGSKTYSPSAVFPTKVMKLSGFVALSIQFGRLYIT